MDWHTRTNVQRYLQGKFKDDLERVRAAMEKLARAYKPEELAEKAYNLYTQFRPEVASGTRGWGQAGELNLGRIESLSSES